MLPFSRLLDALKQIPDPRRDQGKRYPLPYLLLFSILAILSGAKGFSDIIIFSNCPGTRLMVMRYGGIGRGC